MESKSVSIKFTADEWTAIEKAKEKRKAELGRKVTTAELLRDSLVSFGIRLIKE